MKKRKDGVLFLRDRPRRGRDNYQLALLQLAARVPPGELRIVEIAHDGWCSIFKGGRCNCDPAVGLRGDPHDN